MKSKNIIVVQNVFDDLSKTLQRLTQTTQVIPI